MRAYWKYWKRLQIGALGSWNSWKAIRFDHLIANRPPNEIEVRIYMFAYIKTLILYTTHMNKHMESWRECQPLPNASIFAGSAPQAPLC